MCVLPGCKVPVLIREIAPLKYRFVETCNVVGLMDGEAVTMFERGNAEKISFVVE